MITFEQFIADIQHYKLNTIVKNSEKLRVSFKYANGCGSKGGVHFPSTIWGVNIESACNIHDIEWQMAKNFSGLIKANENFDNNLKLICDKKSNSFTAWFRRMRIAKYVSGVELVGTDSYAIERGFI